MIPPRKFLDRIPLQPPTPPEIKVTDCTRLDVVLDTGIGLQFDLIDKDKDTYWEADGKLFIKRGERITRLNLNRILYDEKYPYQLKTIVAPK